MTAALYSTEETEYCIGELSPERLSSRSYELSLLLRLSGVLSWVGLSSDLREERN